MKNKVGTAILMSALGAMGSAASAYAQVAQQLPPVPGQGQPGAAAQQAGQTDPATAAAQTVTPAGQAANLTTNLPEAVLTQSAQFGSQQGTIEESWIINPSLTVMETYTDDVDLDEAFAQSDFVTTTTLGLQVITDGPRFDLNLDYALNHLFYPGLDGDKDEFRHNLQANSSSEVVRDLFYFDAAAGINQQFIDRRGAFTSVAVARTNNRSTLTIVDLNPYLLNRINGNFATMRTGYNYSYVDSSQNITLDGIDLGGGSTQFHEGSIIFDSGTRFTKTTWNWENIFQTQRRTNAEDLDVYSSIVTAEYQYIREVAFIGSIGYMKRIGDQFAQNFDGIVWRVGGRLTPGPRTIVEGTYGKDFFGNTWDFNGSYRITPNLLFTARYNDQYQTFAENALQNFQDGVIQQQFVSGQFSRFKEYTAGIEGTRGRSTITITVARRTTESNNVDTNFTRDSVGIGWTRRLSPRLTLNLVANVMEDDFVGAIQTDRFINLEGRLDYALSANLTAAIEYIHTNREQALFNFVPRGSNYVSVSIGYVF